MTLFDWKCADEVYCVCFAVEMFSSSSSDIRADYESLLGSYTSKNLTLVNPLDGRPNTDKLKKSYNIRKIYLRDPFHTLIGSPWWRIFAVFVTVYAMSLVTYSVIYFYMPCQGRPQSFGEVCEVCIQSA